jgi:integrase
MGRKGIPSAARGGDRAVKRKKSPPGLAVVERDGNWHVHGTVRVGGRRVRVRKSTGLPATEANRADAESARFQIEQEVRDEALHGIKPSVTIEEAALSYFGQPRKRPINEIDVARVEEIMEAFKGRRINSITTKEWNDYLTRRLEQRAVATRERFLNTLVALLNHTREQGWLQTLPNFTRLSEVRKPKSRKRRRVLELTPELVGLMIEEAAPHLKAQLATMWCTGARVSSLLYGCRFCDLTLAPGREQIVFHDTKPGVDVTSALNPWAADVLRAYLLHRGIPRDRETPLFLTDEGKPYVDNQRAYGGQTKTAFKGMRRRVAARLRAAGREAEAALIEQVTPHWFRHYVATNLLAKGFDLATIMEQGGWLRMETVQSYAHAASERQREAAGALDTPDTSLTRDSDDEKKKDDTTTA